MAVITLTEAIARGMPEKGRALDGAAWRALILTTLPWAAALAPKELTAMAQDLEQAAQRWATTGDTSGILEVEDDWRATVDLLGDPETLAHLARRDRTYVRW